MFSVTENQFCTESINEDFEISSFSKEFTTWLDQLLSRSFSDNKFSSTSDYTPSETHSEESVCTNFSPWLEKLLLHSYPENPNNTEYFTSSETSSSGDESVGSAVEEPAVTSAITEQFQDTSIDHNSCAYEQLQPVKRKPERSSTRSHNKKRKLGKLWEFIRSLLQDKSTCPRLIKWHKYHEGEFKFVESGTIAKMWGQRNKNTKMNYEKFSRAMRYYYKHGILRPVPGKRLVYGFGLNAKGWQTDSPILD